MKQFSPERVSATLDKLWRRNFETYTIDEKVAECERRGYHVLADAYRAIRDKDYQRARELFARGESI